MATIPQHISTLRHFIKQHHDDTYYTDEYLYKVLNDARVHMIDLEADKNSSQSDYDEQTVCMPMEVSTYHDCDCLPVDTNCKVLKSKFQLPKIITSNKRKNKYLAKIKTIDGATLGYIEDGSLFKKFKYSKVKKKAKLWTISNNYLILFSSNLSGPKVVLIEAVFEDPASLSNITLCDTNGEEQDENCYTYSDSEFPIKAGWHNRMYREALQMLSVPLQIADDIVNNAISENG